MNLLGRGSDPKFWSETVRNDEIYAATRERFLSLWKNNYEDKPIKALTYSKFKIVAVTGNRNIYENEYFHKRMGLCTATFLSLVYPEEEKYFEYLQDLVFAVLDEFTWSLPFHQPNVMTNTDKDFIDLFACETGSAMAEIYTLLGDRLDPLIKARILVETEQRIIRPFIDKPNFPWWRNGYTGNWAAVCTGSIAMTAMLLHPQYFDEMKPGFDKVIENFLSGFSDSGFCDEGSHYWGYGFGYFVYYAAMLRDFTEGRCDYFKLDKVRRIATYIQKIFLSGKSAVSYADSPRTAEYYYGMVYFLKKEYPDEVMVYSPEYGTTTDGCGRFCHFTRGIIWRDKEIYLNPANDNNIVNYYDEDLSWVIRRTPTYSFSAKGGCNEEHHNHNDVGTFIFARAGYQLIADLGSGVYTAHYGGPESEVSGYYHNIPQFGENTQQRGVQFAASDVVYDKNTFTLDIAGAYGIPELKSLKRSFEIGDNELTLTDKFDYNGEGEITERFILSKAPTEIVSGKITLPDGVILYNPEIQTVSVREHKLSREPFFILEFKLPSVTKEFTITVK